ncbi:hypothetical protein B5G52_01525 [Pseudoalteromonas sp. A601]|nr:hypothetical protein B5G52_01525 [Pseudoalteromonas sp. A601]
MFFKRIDSFFKFLTKNACVKICSPYNATPLRRQSRQRLARQASHLVSRVKLEFRFLKKSLKLSVDKKIGRRNMRSPSDVKQSALIATFFNNIKQSSVWALVQIEF